MQAVRQREPCDDWVAKIWEAGDDCLDGMGFQIRTDRSRMPDIEKDGCDMLEFKIFDRAFRRVKTYVPQMDFVISLLGKKAGDQRTDLSCAKD
jgi:hypothetical protein